MPLALPRARVGKSYDFKLIFSLAVTKDSSAFVQKMESFLITQHPLGVAIHKTTDLSYWSQGLLDALFPVENWHLDLEAGKSHTWCGLPPLRNRIEKLKRESLAISKARTRYSPKKSIKFPKFIAKGPAQHYASCHYRKPLARRMRELL